MHTLCPYALDLFNQFGMLVREEKGILPDSRGHGRMEFSRGEMARERGSRRLLSGA